MPKRAVTAEGERSEQVDPRQLMRQTQQTAQKTKGSQQVAAQGRQSADPTWFYVDKVSSKASTKVNDGQVQQPTAGSPETMDKMSEGRRDAKLDKPTFGEKFKMSSGYRQPAGESPSGAARSQGKPAGGKKKGEKVSPTSSPR
jgi:hypothetical protein